MCMQNTDKIKIKIKSWFYLIDEEAVSKTNNLPPPIKYVRQSLDLNQGQPNHRAMSLLSHMAVCDSNAPEKQQAEAAAVEFSRLL